MALSGGRLRQPSHRSTGEVGFSKAYPGLPLPAKRTSVMVLLGEALPKRRTAANLADFGVDCRLCPGGGSPGTRTLKRRQP
jgi:hypothetical protein